MTPRERLYLAITNRTTLNPDDYLIWWNGVLRSARHQRDLFDKRGKIADEDRMLAWVRKHHGRKGSN